MRALMLGSAPGGGKWGTRSLMDLEIPGSRLPGGNVNGVGVAGGGGFPAFLPKEVHEIKDPFARSLARRIQRLPVQVGTSESCIMSSCIKPVIQGDKEPVVLLHCFDSSCLEWRRTYPLLEDTGVEAWAIDILGWGFSDLERRPTCDAASKRYHLYQLWKSYIKRPMILVGPSLGAAVAIDFAVNFPEAVHKLVLINASVYGEGTGFMTKLPKMVAYGGVSLLKSVPLRIYAKLQCFDGLSLSTTLDWTNVGRLHCLLPWWEDAMVNFMLSGGYNVVHQIKKVNQRTLVIMGMRDKLVSNELAMRLCGELPNCIVHQIPNSGHLPHVDEPHSVTKLIADFARDDDTCVESYCKIKEDL
nr:Alpha/beta hydrolase-1 [Ipomoea batatas]